MLLDKEGYVYKKNGKSKQGNVVNWLCRNYRWNKFDHCRARAKTDGINVILWSGKHNHPVLDHDYSNFYN